MKKFLTHLALGVQIFSGFFAAVHAVEYNDFPATGCESVEVIYLLPDTSNPDAPSSPKLFELVKRESVDDALTLVPNQPGIDGYKSDELKSERVLKRFKFGLGNYKKYCVGFQEAIPVGPQGELSQSIGADSGVDLVKNYISMIYKFGSMFLGLVCVLVIVISGIQMSTGGIDPSAYENAKNRILGAIMSLVLLFSSAMILRTINPGFFT